MVVKSNLSRVHFSSVNDFFFFFLTIWYSIYKPQWSVPRLKRQEKERKKENFLHLTQVETRLWAKVLFLVLYEFLAESWKKQMFISSSSSAFIYIYVPFQYSSSLLVFVGSKITGDRSASEQSWDKDLY